MFYSEYRPQKFKELINAEHIVSSLTGALEKGNVGHAFFFTGSRGIGKTTTARLLAKSINCENPQKGDTEYIHFEPCGECKSCVSVQEGRHLDLIEIDAASNRGIDNIRELRDNVKLSPAMGKNKIYIIDEVHMLTTEASNALLKTLEEPPEHAYFILCTTNPEKVLITMKSRCQQFQFLRPSIGDLVKRLRIIANDQKYEISDGQLKRIAIVAKGAYREAETILEQLMNGDEAVEHLLNEQESNYYEFMSLVFGGDQPDAVKFVHEVYSRGVSIELWTEKLIQYCRSLMLAKMGIAGIDNTFELNDLEKKLVQETDISAIKRATESFSKALTEFKFAVVPTLPLEMAIVDLGITSTDGPLPQEKSPPPSSQGKVEEKPASSRPVVASPKEEIKEESQAKQVSIAFPYMELIEEVKPKNHSIHLILRSCEVQNYDGTYLNLVAFYSFHKERVMSHKIRGIIEEAATTLMGNKVVLKCGLSDKKPGAKSLTDHNIKAPASGGKDKTDEVFEQVFGDELEEAS